MGESVCMLEKGGWFQEWLQMLASVRDAEEGGLSLGRFRKSTRRVSGIDHSRWS